MAYSVNWATRVVTIPKADLALLSASPEIRELNVNQLWTALIDIQDGEEGITFPDIVRNTPPLTFSGLTLARVVEVINSYTITFESGAYNVNVTGGNSNVADVTNKNSVGVNTANSAGLVNVAGGGSLTAAEVWAFLIDGLSAQDRLKVLTDSVAFVKDVVEADEVYTPTLARKLRKGTAVVLIEKTVSGGAVASPPITLTEL